MKLEVQTSNQQNKHTIFQYLFEKKQNHGLLKQRKDDPLHPPTKAMTSWLLCS